jgi:hypothetical protein
LFAFLTFGSADSSPKASTFPLVQFSTIALVMSRDSSGCSAMTAGLALSRWNTSGFALLLTPSSSLRTALVFGLGFSDEPVSFDM